MTSKTNINSDKGVSSLISYIIAKISLRIILPHVSTYSTSLKPKSNSIIIQKLLNKLLFSSISITSDEDYNTYWTKKMCAKSKIKNLNRW